MQKTTPRPAPIREPTGPVSGKDIIVLSFELNAGATGHGLLEVRQPETTQD